MVNYNSSKIYKIISNQTNKIYVGSTTKLYLSQRLTAHKSAYNYWLKGHLKSYITSFDLLKLGDVEIILLENVNANSKDELHARERYYIELYKDIVVNKNIPSRTDDEYNQTEECKLRDKKYRQTEKYKLSHKIYIQSEKGKLSDKKYKQSEKYKLSIKLGRSKYKKSIKNKLCQIRYNQKENVKYAKNIINWVYKRIKKQNLLKYRIKKNIEIFKSISIL